MDKYMRRNSKTIGEVSLMDMPSHVGVRIHAKTLSLQKASSTGVVDASYIQLCSHRLVKPTPSRRQKENRVPSKPNKHSYKGANSSKLKIHSRNSPGPDMELVDGKEEDRQESEIRVAEDLGIDDEASFGENVLEIEGRERYNFDPVNEKPLPGRYEWAKVDGTKNVN